MDRTFLTIAAVLLGTGLVMTLPATVRAASEAEPHVATQAAAVAAFDFMADGEWTTLTTEQLLTAAGFDKKVADTPERLAHLERLTPARKLVAHRRDGKLYYVYADPEMCKCLYVGTATQYRIALEKRMANEELVAMQEHQEDDALLWALWAPWPWPR